MTESADPRRWWILFIMTGSLSMIFIDTTIVTVALPSMQHALGVTQSMIDWVVIVYILVLASLMALGGHLGDRLGKPRAFVAGTIAFGIASILCGLAWDGTSLIVFRILQGMAAVIMQPASSALVIGAFPPGERGRAMAAYAGTALLFMTVGPVVGGLITEYLSWRYCFFVNGPVSIAVAVAAILLRPRDASPARERFDWWGALLLVTGLPALILGIKQGGEWGWNAPLTIGLLAGGGILLAIFIRVELASRHPVVQLGLFRDRGFLGDALMLMITQSAVTGVTIYLGLYLQDILGFSPVRAGAALMPLMIPVLVVMYFAGRAYDRRGVRLPATFGAVVVTAGLALLAVGTSAETYWIMMLGMIAIGSGVPFIQVPSNTDGMSRVGAERRGMASGVLQTFRQTGSVVGLALLAAVIAATGGPETANDVLTVSGTTNAVWTATIITATLVLIAPLTLSNTPGREL